MISNVTGIDGTPGTNGDKGDKGFTGNQGAKGDAADILVGADGSTGPAGIDGTPGAPGDQGPTGAKGEFFCDPKVVPHVYVHCECVSIFNGNACPGLSSLHCFLAPWQHCNLKVRTSLPFARVLFR